MLKLVSDIEFHCVIIAVRKFGTGEKHDMGERCVIYQKLMRCNIIYDFIINNESSPFIPKK